MDDPRNASGDHFSRALSSWLIERESPVEAAFTQSSIQIVPADSYWDVFEKDVIMLLKFMTSTLAGTSKRRNCPVILLLLQSSCQYPFGNAAVEVHDNVHPFCTKSSGLLFILNVLKLVRLRMMLGGSVARLLLYK